MISIIPIMDTNIENRKMVAAVAYPAALEPFLAVDTAFVDVVVPLITMHKNSSADHHQRPTRREVAGRRSHSRQEERSSNHVEDAPQKA